MIYLDHAAATPVSKRVFEAMKPYFSDDFFNPSAAYLPAKKVAQDYEEAKTKIAHTIGAKGHDIVITAGATEANNLAFTAISLNKFQSDVSSHSMLQGKQIPNSCVLYLETEHDSVRRVAESLGGQPIKVLSSGLVDLNDLRNKISDATQMISVALVNNELGTIQPLAEIAQIIREVKLDRMKRRVKTQLLLHSDASQALNLLDINVARLGVDLLTINAAKIYGPKGIGALYATHDVELKPLTVGGGQENGLRGGTENVPLAIGFAKAAEIAHEHINGNRKKYATWRKILLAELDGYKLINKKRSLDNFVVICYEGLDAERLIFALEERSVYLATGAACAASKGVRSHVLKAIGLSELQIAGSLRLTLGETNNEEQIHQAAQIINQVVASERRRIDG